MLYKKKLISIDYNSGAKLYRTRKKSEILNCTGCDVYDSWCMGENRLVIFYKEDGCLYLSSRYSLCTNLKRTLYYEECS